MKPRLKAAVLLKDEMTQNEQNNSSSTTTTVTNILTADSIASSMDRNTLHSGVHHSDSRNTATQTATG